MDAKRSVVTKDQAARIAGIRPARVNYWVRTQIVRPSFDVSGAGRRRVQLFTFQELMSLMVAVQLRDRGISLQHVRAVVRRLETRGYDLPLAQLVFATEGKRIYFQDEHGEWESGQHPGHAVISEMIDLGRLQSVVSKGVSRSEEARGVIERRRGTMGAKPVFAGTRVPVATVRRYLEAGKTERDVLEAFPTLTPEDVATARQSA